MLVLLIHSFCAEVSAQSLNNSFRGLKTKLCVNMPHIMLSYQWDSQPLAKKVFEALEGLGFDAWMDLEDMSGNINEAMAAGLFNLSSYVLNVLIT